MLETLDCSISFVAKIPTSILVLFQSHLHMHSTILVFIGHERSEFNIMVLNGLMV
jgi:hypothetical protein